MNKLSINVKLPFAVQDKPVVNPQNGYTYTKRITQEFKDLQEFCKDKSIFFNGKDEECEKVEGKACYKNIWFNMNPAYVSPENVNELTSFIYKAFNNQTPTKHPFEN